MNNPSDLKKLLDTKKAPAQSAPNLSKLRKTETDLVERQRNTMSFFCKVQIDAETTEEMLKEIKADLTDVRRRIQDLNRLNSIRSIDDRLNGFMAAMPKLT